MMAKDQFKREREEEKREMSKADVIRASKMPAHQKEQYLRDIGEVPQKEEVFDPSKVTFQVYAQIRDVPKDRRQAMLVFPKASGVKLATLSEWDEIYKNF